MTKKPIIIAATIVAIFSIGAYASSAYACGSHTKTASADLPGAQSDPNCTTLGCLTGVTGHEQGALGTPNQSMERTAVSGGILDNIEDSAADEVAMSKLSGEPES